MIWLFAWLWRDVSPRCHDVTDVRVTRTRVTTDISSSISAAKHDINQHWLEILLVCPPLSSQPSSSSSECPLKRDMMSTLCAISLRPCQSHLLETIRVQQTKHLRPFFSLQQNRNKLAFCFRSRTYPRHYGTTGGNMQNQKAAVGINFRL